LLTVLTLYDGLSGCYMTLCLQNSGHHSGTFMMSFLLFVLMQTTKVSYPFNKVYNLMKPLPVPGYSRWLNRQVEQAAVEGGG
jgi:hypothetical protein